MGKIICKKCGNSVSPLKYRLKKINGKWAELCGKCFKELSYAGSRSVSEELQENQSG